MATRNTAVGEHWLARWLDWVAEGRATMSQRSLASIARHGGIAAARREARRRSVHLLVLADDEGREVVAASRTPFRVIC